MSLAEISSPQGPDSEGWPAIERLSVTELFGRYSYQDISLGRSRSEASVALFYGDNGSGKTTILKLLYSCLCPAQGDGHRTYLSKTRFRSFKVEFRDGATIEIVKDSDSLIGSYIYLINRKGDHGRFHVKTEKDNSVKGDTENPDLPMLHKELEKLKIDLLFLQDDRTIKSTYRFFTDDRHKVIFSASHEAAHRALRLKSDWGLLNFDEIDLIEKPSPEAQNLSRVINAVGEWLRQSAFQKSSSGDEDASNVYLNVIQALAQSGAHRRTIRANKAYLLDQLKTLSDTAADYKRYGLVGAYPIDEFMRIVRDAPEARIDDMASLLTPYIDSVLSRLNAMADIKSLISSFEHEINGYLKDKRCEIHLQKDLQFFDDEEHTLSPSQLSTGERQLAFLFCASLLARSGHTIFMIDEPELSLNVKWQRRLVSSLVNLGRGATTQFIMATHSIEIMARHRDAVIKLG